MEREKFLVPSVISLHVREIDHHDKESLKSLLNFENTNSRKFSYNLVRIYNSGYPNIPTKSLNDNITSYSSSLNTKTDVLTSSLINSRFNSLIKKTSSEIIPLYSTCRLPNSNHHWSNAFKNNQLSTGYQDYKNVFSSSTETEISKASNSLYNSTLFTSNKFQNENIKSSNVAAKKKPQVATKSESNQEIPQPFQAVSGKMLKPSENISKIPPILIANQLSLSHIEVSNKSQSKKCQISMEKFIPKRQSSSLVIPIKERSPIANLDMIPSSPVRSQTLITKVSNFTPKPISLSSVSSIEESRKISVPSINEVSQRNDQLSSINNQSFLYPDPCDNESSITFMNRVSELTACVNETIRWEKTRFFRRRLRQPTEIL